MTSPESKNALLVMVLTDLSAICQKLAESAITPEHLRIRAAEFVMEFHTLPPARGRGTALQHFQGEALLTKIAAFCQGCSK